MIVNAIQAIEERGEEGGRVFVRALRSTQAELDGFLPDIVGFQIEDNGVGFTDAHRDAFDTLYTDHRIAQGGKGFGRFTCLKYFEDLTVQSVFREGSGFKSRSFSMGKDHDIVIGEKVMPTEGSDSGTIVDLVGLRKEKGFEKELRTVSRNLVELLLPYFITEGYSCPRIVLSERDNDDQFVLNDFLRNEGSDSIREIPVEPNTFTLQAAEQEEEFLVRVFRIYSPRNQKSRISLVAHQREVSGSILHNYIPEFEDEFYEKEVDAEVGRPRNYIIKAYVFGPYLEKNVSLERGGFEFAMEDDLLLGIGQAAIEKDAAMIARDAVGTEISLRAMKKQERLQSYVDEKAPWHKDILGKIDLSEMSYQSTNEDIEALLQREKFAQETAIREDVVKLLGQSTQEDFKEEDFKEKVGAIVRRISDTSKNDLIHYIATRREVLQLLERGLESDPSGGYSSEGLVHDIIFPRRGDTENTSFQDHNLWILDERLNFTSYVSSDPASQRQFGTARFGGL